jgi:hypothetical protein
MARGDVIGPADIVPRHLLKSAEMPALTIEVGNTTVAEAKKQLVLRTLATTGGDMVRTAKVLGLDVGEVAAEISGLLNGNGTPPKAAASHDGVAHGGAAHDGAAHGDAGAERAPARKGAAAHPPAAKGKTPPAKAKKR